MSGEAGALPQLPCESACALCGGAVSPSGGVRARFGLIECLSCGHVQSPAASSSREATEAIQREHFGDDFVGRRDWWTRAFEQMNARRVRRLLAAVVPGSARCLEVGPGSGALMAELARAGYVVEGLDISEGVAQAVSARVKATVRAGSLEEFGAEMGAGQYDLVVMRHVLEHMTRPGAALATVLSMLTPGGLLYLAVPNAGALEAALPGWTGYQPYHLHYFTLGNLRRLIERADFQVMRARTREPLSGWVNAVVNSIRGASRAGADARSRPGGRVMMAYNAARLVAGGVMWPLRVLQSRAGRGEEIEIVARKPGAQ